MTMTTEQSRTMPNAATAGDVASLDEIRAHFPALARRHAGKPVAYLDGPGGTQVPRSVADSMTDYLLHHNANTHWLYPTSEETDAMLLAARETLADFLGASADEISFGNNMTSIALHLSRGIARQMQRGDEIVITELDHHANVAPWTNIARDLGLTVQTVRLDPATGRHDWQDLQQKITPRTKLLAIGAASNALGTITDVRAAVALAKDVGALTFVDAVHYAPHALVDVRAIDCDFLACSAYKFYGPHVGILFAKRDVGAKVDIPKLIPSPDTMPERFETGTQNHEGIVGAAAAVDFLASLSRGGGSRRARLADTFAALHGRGDALLARLWNGLREIDGLTIYGPPPGTPRTPTVSFTIAGRTTDDIARAYAKEGLFVSNGDFYAATVVERLGQSKEGLVRVGCSAYTTADEVDRLLEATRAMRA